MKKYEEPVEATPETIAIVGGSVGGGILVTCLGIFGYKKYKSKKDDDVDDEREQPLDYKI